MTGLAFLYTLEKLTNILSIVVRVPALIPVCFATPSSCYYPIGDLSMERVASSISGLSIIPAIDGFFIISYILAC
jgi:hypothetical protein